MTITDIEQPMLDWPATAASMPAANDALATAISDVIDELVTAAVHFNYGDAKNGRLHLDLALMNFSEVRARAPRRRRVSHPIGAGGRVMAEPQPLEQAAVERLTAELMHAVRAHYLRRPIARSSAQEVLNALAVVTAVVLVAAEHNAGAGIEAEEFFDLALENQIKQLQAETPRLPEGT
jgi:hypothetical protein